MSFIWPVMLVALLVVPLLIALYLRLQGQRRQAARHANLGFAPQAAGRRLGARRHIPPALFLLALTVLIVALARPQMELSLPKLEGTVVLVFDVSGSMAADDLKPTRMDAAKVAAREFVKRQPPTIQIGVVAFSDGGLSVQAPTNEQDTLLAAINRLTPQRGTSVGQGILAALKTIDALKGLPTNYYSNRTPTPTPTPTPMPKGTFTSAAIVLLTDGENNENPDPLAVAQAAADRGVRIYTIGIGSAAGTTLHINGFTVHTRLNEPALQQIAQLTEGAYYNVANQDDLRRVYDTLDFQWVVKSEKTEVTALFAMAGILLMLTGGAFSLLWFSRLP
jgi:Ca-activated chloride channel family protein